MVNCCLMIVLLIAGIDVETLTAELHVETGMAYIDQGLSEKALGEFTTALEISELAWEAHLGLARIAVINNSWTTAEEEYATYMNLEPDDYRAPLEMAEMLLLLRGRSVVALEYAEIALSLAPLNGICWLVMADSESGVGNTVEAISWYTRIIVENEELAEEARVRLGMLLFRDGNLAEAREILLPAANSGKNSAHKILALIYMEQNDALRAIDSINRYLYLEPNGLWADSARACLEELSSTSLNIN
ncbi:MAG: tetratricopeptide repeat protein [bacterium]|nr:tetratricopeptide repeat protein [bacterium]